MSKTITSPIKRFPGTVELPDALTWPQYMAWTRALEEAQTVTGNEMVYKVLGGVLACVEKWNIVGVQEQPTIETFPATPPASVSKLISWVMDAITAMVSEADEAPNG